MSLGVGRLQLALQEGRPGAEVRMIEQYGVEFGAAIGYQSVVLGRTTTHQRQRPLEVGRVHAESNLSAASVSPIDGAIVAAASVTIPSPNLPELPQNLARVPVRRTQLSFVGAKRRGGQVDVRRSVRSN